MPTYEFCVQGPEVDIGEVYKGSEARWWATLANTGPVPVTLREVGWGLIRVVPEEDPLPKTIPPGEEIRLDLRKLCFQPTGPLRYQMTLACEPACTFDVLSSARIEAQTTGRCP